MTMSGVNLVEGTWVTVNEAVYREKYKAAKWGTRKRAKPTVLERRIFSGMIERDSYGEEAGQHTFSIRIQEIMEDPSGRLRLGDVIQRKGRTLYENLTDYKHPTDYKIKAKIKDVRKSINKRP